MLAAIICVHGTSDNASPTDYIYNIIYFRGPLVLFLQ